MKVWKTWIFQMIIKLISQKSKPNKSKKIQAKILQYIRLLRLYFASVLIFLYSFHCKFLSIETNLGKFKGVLKSFQELLPEIVHQTIWHDGDGTNMLNFWFSNPILNEILTVNIIYINFPNIHWWRTLQMHVFINCKCIKFLFLN